VLIVGGNQSASGYDVDNGLRFNDGSSDNLSRANGTPTDRKKYTFNGWVKRSHLGTRQRVYGVINPSSTAAYAFAEFESSTDTLHIDDFDGSSTRITRTLRRKFRDITAWYNIHVQVDTTLSTGSDRMKVFINGVQETEFSHTNDGSQNYDTCFFNSSKTFHIGRAGHTSFYFDGYQCQTIAIDGQALDPDNFGEFDADSGIWKPINPSGLTFGNDGFWMEYKDSSNLGLDSSGNGNNFTVNNLTSIDQVTDTPTNNFATYNSIFGIGRQNQLTYSEANTVVASSATSGSDTTAASTFAFDSGKWYAEFKATNDAVGIYVGVATSSLSFTNSGIDTSGNSNCWIVRGDDGTVRNNGSTAYFGTAFSDDDIISIAIDMDNSKIWWALNGTYGNSGNPATGANPAFSNLSGELMIIVGDNFSSKTPTIKANFGNPAFSISSSNSDSEGYGNFEYAVPSGYHAINTKNLAEYG